MADKDKTGNPPVTSSAKPAAKPVSLHDQFKAAMLLTPVGGSIGLMEHLLGPQIRTSVKDFVVNTVDTVMTVGRGFDTQKADKDADWVQEVLDKATSPIDGQYNFRMAKGWKMPEGMKYNGLLPSDPQYKGPKPGEKIQSFWTMFSRDKEGNVELLDKGDPRFWQTMGPYAFVQAALAATIGTKGLTSIKPALAASTTTLGKLGTATYLGAASADLYGAGAQIARQVKHSIFLNPVAIDRFAHMIDKPEALTQAQIVKDVMLFLEDHAKKKGRNTSPYYIEPPTSAAEAMKLLDQMSKGQVSGYVRSNPFSEIAPDAKKEDIQIGNLRAVADNLHFQRSFFKLAIKAVEAGDSMTPSERMALRFGMNLLYAQKDLPLTAPDSKSEQELHNKSLNVLKGYLSEPHITARFREYFTKDKTLSSDDVTHRVQLGVLAWMEAGRKDLAPDKDMVAMLKQDVVKLDAEIKKETEIQQVQAINMAYGLQ